MYQRRCIVTSTSLRYSKKSIFAVLLQHTVTSITLLNSDSIHQNQLAGLSGLVVTRLTAVCENLGSNPTVSDCVFYHETRCDIQLCARAAHHYCSAQLTQPSILHGTTLKSLDYNVVMKFRFYNNNNNNDEMSISLLAE